MVYNKPRVPLHRSILDLIVIFHREVYVKYKIHSLSTTMILFRRHITQKDYISSNYKNYIEYCNCIAVLLAFSNIITDQRISR